MSLLSPFQALRPTRDKVHLISTKSPKLYEKEALRLRIRTNPYSFFNVLRPAKGRTQGRLPFRQRLTSVKMRYEDFCKAGHMTMEHKPAYYVYQQRSENGIFTGVIGLMDLKHFDQGRVKIHEETITPRVQLFQTFLETCRFHAEPILMTHPDNHIIRDVRNQATEGIPEYDFTSTDGVRHTLWIIDNPGTLVSTGIAFNDMEKVYVADGHHRLASSLAAQQSTGENQVMVMYVPQHQLSINTFKWIIKDVNRMDTPQILEELRKHYDVVKLAEYATPLKQGRLVIGLEDSFYQLEVKPHNEQGLSTVDQHFLKSVFISPILGIEDLRNDPRIRFEPDVDRDGQCGGLMTVFFAPLEIDQIKSIADQGLMLPPKTTYVLPKLRTAMTIYPFKD